MSEQFTIDRSNMLLMYFNPCALFEFWIQPYWSGTTWP